VWGATILLAGADIWYIVDGRRPTRDDDAAVRFLGARHLVEGLAQTAIPSRFQRFYLAVDVTHAVSMLYLAIVDERRRRPAILSGAAALGAAALTLAARRRARAARTAREG
jgi:hypothetical protein